MSDIVINRFNELIKELKEEGWNDDIIDNVKMLFKKYKKEKDDEI